jgi:site-specific DNA recombinase
MKAVTYGRYSSDKQRETSIDDQVRNCRNFIAREGWELTQTYSDEAITGSTSQRVGYQQLLADADAGLFDVLVVDDLSRLSRDDVEMKQVVRRFRFKRMRIIGVSDGFDSDSKGHKIHAGVRGLINEIFLDDLRDKTHRGLTGQAMKGFSCGGRTYGYRNVPIEDPNRKDEYGRPLIVAVRREVIEEQAKWVNFIFESYADGNSPRWIAHELNKNSVPATHGGKWAASAIHGHMKTNTGLLNNEIYIGRSVWNRSQWVKDPDSGNRRRLMRPESDWVVTNQPELRIVSDELWSAVKVRQKAQYEKGLAKRQEMHDGARIGAGPKYLFSGLLKCGCCGANYILTDYYRYGCAWNRDRGESVCTNSVRIPRKLLESKLLSAIKVDLFTAEGLEWFQREVKRVLAEKKSKNAPNLTLVKKRLLDIEKEIENIMNAIKAGIITSTVKGELEKAETSRRMLKEQIEMTGHKSPEIALSPEMLKEAFGERINSLEDMSSLHIAKARRHIGAMVGKTITLRPNDKGSLTAELCGDYAGLLEFVSGKSKLNLVAGARFELTTFRL